MKQFVIDVPENVPVSALVDYLTMAAHHYKDYLYYYDTHKFGDEVAETNLERNDELTQIITDAQFTNEEWLTAADLIGKYNSDVFVNYNQIANNVLISKQALLDMADEEDFRARKIKERGGVND
jgi:hypothetical protein